MASDVGGGLLESEREAAEFDSDGTCDDIAPGVMVFFAGALLEEFDGFGFAEDVHALGGELVSQIGEAGGDEPADAAGLVAEGAHGFEGLGGVGIVCDNEGGRHGTKQAQGQEHEVLGAGFGVICEAELCGGVCQGGAQ